MEPLSKGGCFLNSLSDIIGSGRVFPDLSLPTIVIYEKRCMINHTIMHRFAVNRIS